MLNRIGEPLAITCDKSVFGIIVFVLGSFVTCRAMRIDGHSDESSTSKDLRVPSS